jgi:molybdenum cofactor cytidylyltransferase
MIKLRSALRLGPAPQVAFVGAGGKTSALFILGRQFDGPVIVSTSTHLGVDQVNLANAHMPLSKVGDLANLDPSKLAGVTAITSWETSEGRLQGLDSERLIALSQFARQHNMPLLIEADGARRLALKAPAEHEPSIPDFVDTVIVSAGLTGLGAPIAGGSVHRPELFAQLAEVALETPLTPQMLARVLLHPQGGLKNIPPGARKIVILNQADTPELEGAARGLSEPLLAGYDAVLVAAFKQSSEVKIAYENAAGIILAAGVSERLGRSKQLLDWKGKPFVRQVAETALAAGLRPVVLVTGADAPNTEAAVEGLDLQIVRNERWLAGQSSSVKAGLAALPANIGSALFMVVDQPQLPVALIEALRAEHAAALSPIVAPLVDGHRSNPVLFDRSTFADFAALEGDVGGRAIFSKHPVSWVQWLDPSLAIDVDRPEDYDRLLRQAG